MVPSGSHGQIEASDGICSVGMMEGHYYLSDGSILEEARRKSVLQLLPHLEPCQESTWQRWKGSDRKEPHLHPQQKAKNEMMWTPTWYMFPQILELPSYSTQQAKCCYQIMSCLLVPSTRECLNMDHQVARRTRGGERTEDPTSWQ